MNNFFKPPGELQLTGNVSANWKKFKQKYLLFVDATGESGATDKIKISMLLSLVGDEGLEVYNTFKYVNEDGNDLQVVLRKFQEYCDPRKNVIFERYKFSLINQKEGQSFDAYLVELQKAVASCEYVEEESLIRDKIVLGVLDKGVQERMLREPTLTLQKAIEFCRAAEISRYQVKTLREKTVDVVRLGQERREDKARQPVNYKLAGKGGAPTYECRKCCYSHKRGNCPAYGKTCIRCKQLNHFARGCPQGRQQRINEISQGKESEGDDFDSKELYMDSVGVKQRVGISEVGAVTSWKEVIGIGRGQGKDHIEFKLDSGAEASIIPLVLLQALKDDWEPCMRRTQSVLVAFGKTNVIPVGIITLECSTRNVEKVKIDFMVVDFDMKPLLGLRDCLRLKLMERINTKEVRRLTTKEEVLEKFKDVFEGMGCMPGYHTIKLKENASPVVHPPRRVPVSLQEKLKQTLGRLEKKGIISSVDEPTDWVSSLVIREKPSGELRLCLDPKDLNRAIKREFYYIPRAEDLISRLSNKSVFSVMDMREGFWHIRLEAESAKLCTFNTPFGRYCFNRLPYGLCSAPEVFQKKNNEIFSNIRGCEVYFDDLIIGGETDEEHDEILLEVLTKARENGVRFNTEKIQFRVPEVKYVGRVISGKGIKTDPEQVRAIIEMKTPSDRAELMRMLGMSNYLSPHIPDLSTITAPLRNLIRKNTDWVWLPEHETAIKQLKSRLTQAPVLAVFNSNLPLTLQVDASRDGLGACLIQAGHPISYSSRSLTDTEKRYAQIEKELLAIVHGVLKYHHYTYGRPVQVLTDHKPLEAIFKKDISQVTSRLQRMLLKLLKYNLEVKYIPGSQMYMADTLSRAFIEETDQEGLELDYEVHTLSKHLPMSTERKEEFVKATQEDEQLQELMEVYKKGWPERKNQCLLSVRCFWNCRERITVEEELVFLDSKLIVPQNLRPYVLNLLHEGHMGMGKTKQRAREILWWPGITNQIEKKVSECETCRKLARANGKEKMLSHPIPSRPWQRIATDIFQYGSNDYLVINDYYSRWIEILSLEGKTAGDVIRRLKSVFARLGIPDVIVSDNMPFGSWEFQAFARDYGFQSVTTSPHHPQANGLAEKGVSIAKTMLRKAREENKDIFLSLMEYRNTPMRDTGVSPAQLMLGRRMKTKLPVTEELLTPRNFDVNIKAKLELQRKTTKGWYDRRARDLTPLKKGDPVLIRKETVWEPGKIIREAESPRSYIVQQEDGRDIRRNRQLLRKMSGMVPVMKETWPEESPEGETGESLELDKPAVTQEPKGSQEVDSKRGNNGEGQLRTMTRSGRVINRPSRYED